MPLLHHPPRPGPAPCAPGRRSSGREGRGGLRQQSGVLGQIPSGEGLGRQFPLDKRSVGGPGLCARGVVRFWPAGRGRGSPSARGSRRIPLGRASKALPPQTPSLLVASASRSRFLKHRLLTLINTFWGNSCWLPSKRSQLLSALCRGCGVCSGPARPRALSHPAASAGRSFPGRFPLREGDATGS